jgi:hypothetical protein
MHWTRLPLNSRPSSFSTAVLRSAADSNSTNPRPPESRPVSEYTTSRLDCRAKSLRSYSRNPSKSQSGKGKVKSPPRTNPAKSKRARAKGCPRYGEGMPWPLVCQTIESLEGPQGPSITTQVAIQSKYKKATCSGRRYNRSVESWNGERGEGTDLPAGIRRKTRDLHAMGSPSWAGRLALVAAKGAFARAAATGKLNSQALPHKVGSIFKWRSHISQNGSKRGWTRDGKASGSGWGHIRKAGTTSRASMGSLYSMKPKPFISFTSVMSPVPCFAKWASMSALVAVP